MRAFKLDEISAVDRPAQEGALATLMKRDSTEDHHGMPRISKAWAQETLDMGATLMNGIADFHKGRMTEVQKAAMLHLAKVVDRRRAMLNSFDDGYGENDPAVGRLTHLIEAAAENADLDEDEDEDTEKAKATHEDHEGDWYHGSDSPVPGHHPDDNTRVDGYVSSEEADDYREMDEDEEIEKEDEDEPFFQEQVARLGKRFPKADRLQLERTAAARLEHFNRTEKRGHAFNRALAKGASSADAHASASAVAPRTGLEREEATRFVEVQVEELRKADRDLPYSRAIAIVKRRYPSAFAPAR